MVFEDVAAKAGLTVWHHTMGTPAKQFILEAPGSGVALLDYDKDGWLDIYMVNGSTYDALAGKAAAPHAALFHNNHDGTFTDVAAKAGVTNDRWGFGVAVGDYDNDGWPDLYVANFGKNRLYHNNHDGTFTDMAEKAGCSWAIGRAGRPLATTTATAGSISSSPATCTTTMTSRRRWIDQGGVAANFCQFRGVNVMCGPRGLKGEHDHLFHNNGDGTFTDVSQKAGVAIPMATTALPRFSWTSTTTARWTCWWPTTLPPTTCTSTKATAPSKMTAMPPGMP